MILSGTLPSSVLAGAINNIFDSLTMHSYKLVT